MAALDRHLESWFRSPLKVAWRAWRRSFGRAGARPSLPSALSLTPEGDSQRLARLGGWCLDGRLAAAELELCDWRREPTCPASALLLLATAQTRRGAHDEAIDTLWAIVDGPPTANEEAAEARQMLIALLTTGGADDAALHEAASLRQSHGHDTAIAAWLGATTALDASQRAASLAPPAAQARALAEELRDHVEWIPSLTAAQRAEPDAAELALLRAALACLAEMVGGDRDHALIVIRAAAELALLAADHDDARRWAHRGLALHPYSAPLALVLARVSDDPAAGPGALRVLRGAVKAHPGYADLRAALIRRARAEGKRDLAASELRMWLIEDPRNARHPLAERLQAEIAA